VQRAGPGVKNSKYFLLFGKGTAKGRERKKNGGRAKMASRRTFRIQKKRKKGSRCSGEKTRRLYYEGQLNRKNGGGSLYSIEGQSSGQGLPVGCGMTKAEGGQSRGKKQRTKIQHPPEIAERSFHLSGNIRKLQKVT